MIVSLSCFLRFSWLSWLSWLSRLSWFSWLPSFPRQRKRDLVPFLAVASLPLLFFLFFLSFLSFSFFATLVVALLPSVAQAQARPVVSSIDLIAGRFDLGAYAGARHGVGDRIWIAVRLSEDVRFRDTAPSSAEPTLTVMIGGRMRETSFDHIANYDHLIFKYDVVAGDGGRIRVGEDALRDNGNTIYRRGGRSGVAGDRADLSHTPVDLGHQVGGPTHVTDLKAEPSGDGRLKVTWTAAVYAPRGYRLFYTDLETNVQRRWSLARSGTVITGLTNGQAYRVRVDTLNEDGTKLDSTAVYATGTAGAPTRVMDLKASPGNGRLTITWTAAASAPKGYRLFYRAREQGALQHRVTPAISGTVITGLVNGQEYTIRVDTLDAAGRKADRTAVYTVGTPGAVAQVTDLAVEPGDGRLTVTWAAAAYAPRGYRLRYRASGTDAPWRRAIPAVSGAVIAGLVNRREYEVRVDTLDRRGRPADGTAVTSVGTPDGLPTRVTDLSVEAGAKGELIVRWVATAYAPDGYRLRWRTIDGGFGAGRTLAAGATSEVIAGLDDGTVYRVRIDSLTADDRLASGTAVAKDGTTLPGAAPTALRLTEGASGTMNVSWSAGSGVRGGYRVRWRQSGVGQLSVGRVVPSGTTTTILGLAAGTRYIVRVDALDSSSRIIAGASAKASLTLRNGSQVPTVADVRLIAGQFDGTAYAGGSYEEGDTIWVSVRFSEAVAVRDVLGSRASLILIIGDRERKATLQGQLDRADFRFGYEVAARDAGPIRVKGNSLRDRGNPIYRLDGDVDAESDRASLLHDAVDTGHRVGRIARVRGLGVQAGDGALEVRWMAASDAPHGYLVRWRVRGAGSALSAGEVQSGTRHTITGLSNGTAYVVRVDKRDADGRVVRHTSSAVAGTPTVAGVPTPPRRLRLVPGSAGATLDVLWDPALVAPNGYLVRWRESGRTALNAGRGVPSGTRYTITGLTIGTTYIVRVDTRDRGGNAIAGVSASASASAPEAPVGVTVHDARGDEGTVIAFRVDLSKRSSREVRVRWHTEPWTATEGRDYVAGRGELTFAPGETEKTIRVQTRQDAHDDAGEIFRVSLSDARGAQIRNNRPAIGTIANDDPIPASWLAHLGRSTSEQVLDGVIGRLGHARSGDREGFRGMLAGVSVGAPDGREPLSDWSDDWPVRGERPMTLGEILSGSRFTLAGERDPSGLGAAVWGRGAQSRFDAVAGTTDLDATVLTGLVGADYGGADWLAGATLVWSDGEGGYRDPGAGSGEMEASLGAVVPYASLRASEDVDLWAALGHGSGTMRLTLGESEEFREFGGLGAGGSSSLPSMRSTLQADLDWSLLAAGLRSELFEPSEPHDPEGPVFALVSDVMWSAIDSSRVEAVGAGSSLAPSRSETTRLRLGLEGRWPVPLVGGGSFVPRLETGLRHDGGDAGRGLGVDLGGGVAWSLPRRGLSVGVSGRTLLTHDSEGRRAHDLSMSVGYDPRPRSARGLSLSLRHETGVRSGGGLDALLASGPLASSLGASEAIPRGVWSAEIAYGLSAFGNRFTARPIVGVDLSGTGAVREDRLGLIVTPVVDPDTLSLGIEATRRSGGAPGVGVELKMRW